MSFPAQRLHAYRAALEALVAFVPLAESWPRGWADLRDQGKRAATSAVLNIAEGASLPPGGRAKGRHFAIALGSLGEVAAVLDAASALKLGNSPQVDELQAMVERAGALVGGLLRRAEGRQAPSPATSGTNQIKKC